MQILGQERALALEQRKVLQVSEHTGLVLCGEEDLPPTTWEAEELDGWTPTGEVLDFDLGEDGWMEGHVMNRG